MKALQPYIAPRACTEAEAGKSKAEAKLGSQSLEKHSDEGAYVLLAPPGSGKTSEFRRQAKLCDGQFVSARDFIAFEDNSEWHGRTLFIDGLDEVRAGSADGRTSFDGIRKKLLQLGKPKFRLSCREADWFGSNDRRHLETVAPEGKVLVLRLDPLPEEEIKAILRKNHNIDNPDAFVDKARQRGVAALLENPLSLELLVKAVMKNEWPDSRIRTFEMACETLADETNEEHQYAKIRDRANTKVLLDTAGQLCAVLLLAGAPGIQLSAGSQDDNFIKLNELTGTNRALQLESLKTRLFEAPNSEFAIPLHRHVAEFLGARYLAELVENGLPVNRILALMSGYDGMVVTEMRGLCAWLATLCGTSRGEIITRDPLGTVLYGDVAGFPPQDKERIIRELKKVSEKDHEFLGTIEFDSRLGDLVSPELTNEILAILEDSARDGGRQSLTLFLIEALCHVHPLGGMSCTLMTIARDGSRWLSVRKKAIDAYLRQMEDREQALEDLKSLMQEVYANKLPDPEDELLGYLLEKTYPDALPGTEVLDYLRTPKSSQYIAYSTFWTWTLPNPERSSWGRKVELLDRLAEQYTALEPEERQSGTRSDITMEVPFVLLDEVLSDRSVTVEVEPERLFGWLGVAGRLGDWNFGWGILHERKQRVQSWLSQRPGLWKILFKIGVERCKRACGESDQTEFQQLMYMEEDRRLLGVRPPADFATWCLEEAISTDDMVAAQWMVRRVADEIEEGRISKELVVYRLQDNDTLGKALQERLVQREEFRTRENARKEKAEKRNDVTRWQNAVRDHQAELIENRAPMQLLHNLARAYFGGYHGMGEYTPHDRLRILLGSDKGLVETALSGFRATVSRTDLPTVEKVISLSTQERIHFLSLPFLAGFNEWHESKTEGAFVPDEDQNSLAATIFYNFSFWPNPWGYGATQKNPRWIQLLLNEQPELIAEIVTKSISPGLRKSQDFSNRLYELVYSKEYESVAEIVAIPLLRSFPVRCTEQQLPELRFLLIAAARHCPKDMFIEMAREKLEHTSMNVAQRVYWLAAGLVSSPQYFSESLRKYVAGNKRRVRHLGTYIGGRFDQLPVQPDQNDVSAIATLIRLLGTEYAPSFFELELDSSTEDDKGITWGTDISYRIDHFVHQLMENPSHKATEELEKLVNDEGLGVWRTRLDFAIGKQKGIKREADFQHTDVSAILGVLENRQPANTADLATLTFDHLSEIATRIRDGNTSDWRQYWNVDPHNRVKEPKPEDGCRDALLSDLRLRLEPIDIDAQREGNYADDKRADIRVSYGKFNVPIEIKRRHHRDLWTAIRTQLIAKYTRDPGADDHGIYLVFWFGNHETGPLTPDAGPPPKSAKELNRRLEESLTDAERRKISVCVIDVEDRKNQEESNSNSHEQ